MKLVWVRCDVDESLIVKSLLRTVYDEEIFIVG